MEVCGWSAVVGVGRAKRQLQQRGLGDPFGEREFFQKRLEGVFVKKMNGFWGT
jgi:hypothetical protein